MEQHDTKESCWFVVDGKVYDATPFLKEHPGARSAAPAQPRSLADLSPMQPSI